MPRSLFAILLLTFALLPHAAAQTGAPRSDPPLAGAATPSVEARKGDDGIWHQSWFVQGFLDLKEDHAAAGARGKNFAVIFAQRGCIYCTKMHTEVLAQRYINDYVAANFDIVQLDLFGAREVTDFDGERMPEKKLAEKWGVLFTPTIVFVKEDLAGLEGKSGAPIEVARMSLGFGAATFVDLFGWVRTKAYQRDRNFQRYHIERMALRESAKAGEGKPRTQ
jgi:thioredoxin-related protein